MSTQSSRLLPAVATIGIMLQSLPVMAQAPGNYGDASFPPAGSNYSAPPGGDYYNSGNYNAAASPGYQRGQVVYVPAGMTIPVRLATSISTDVAKPGDTIEATLSDPINLGSGAIPAGTTIVGSVTEAKSGGFLGRAGMLTVKFNRLRLPNGQDVPMSAHIVGDIGKYTQTANGSDTVAGETWKNKVGQTVGRGVIGAGVGAALGTAVGAIAGAGEHRPWFRGGGTYAGSGAGTGAWSGAAIGGGVGVADGLLLRKGKQVNIASGTALKLQLDAPMQISQGPQAGQF